MLSRAGLLGWAGLAAVVMLAGPALAGPRWDWFKWFRPKKLQSPASQVGPEQARPAQAGPLEGTIGSVAYIRGLRTMVVRGYGVVAGLGKNGSKECPPSIRNYLTQQIAKRYRLGSVSSGLAWLRPEDLLADLDTAVVMVTGRIPAAAQPGTRFDVQVEALPRTQTRSLANGRLYTCELKLYRGGLASELVGARTLARAAGPIFVNPFAESSGSANALRATVLGGGVTLEPRRIQLVLIVPSYQLASRVRDRINERFGADPPTADAISPSLIRLRIPKAWRGAEKHFLGLLTHLYLYDDPSAAEQRAAELTETILQADAPREDIALAWEAMGRGVLPVIRPLYAHRNRAASFYAARTGCRLGDELAIEALARHSRDPRSRYRLAAIEALGQASQKRRAAGVLEPLLADQQQQVRLAAYEALARLGSPRVAARRVGQDNFQLEVVSCDGPGLIVAKRSGQQRITLLGPKLWCLPPLFYVHPDGAITIDAAEGATQLTLIRRTPFSHLVSEPIHVGLSVEQLIRKLGDDPVLEDDGQVRGLGLTYTQVMRVLAELCRTGAIPARFVLAEPALAEMLGPQPRRPESEF